MNKEGCQLRAEDFSVETYNSLLLYGINTYEELMELTAEGIMGIKNIPDSATHEIHKALINYCGESRIYDKKGR